MGELLSDDGAPGRRRHPHPAAAVSGSRHQGAVSEPGGPGDLDETAMRDLLAAVLRPERVDAEGETRAVAAFRAARDAGAHRARTRRRDDWRPRGKRGPARSLKGVLSLFAVSLTLGGVAFAAIGSGGSGPEESGEDRRRGVPTRGTPAPDAGGTTATPPAGTVPARPGHPLTAAGTEAHCRAYERGEGRGNAMAAPAWKRLTEAAGGPEKVAEYCARQQQRRQGEGAGAPTRTREPNGRAYPKAPSPPDTAATPEARPTSPEGRSGQRGRDKATGGQGGS
ncbi:hypothetical protein [Streptomyces sp. JB150]|uniref:hypothetical protein n=1 Tax=Streptomyces sp. JB150 TaxID=2714844 RepID=UPI0014075377|nr:hypothetical protein [Streptomyces sp. JB150]QIJ64345.1 hypothetical protein G7Z13_21810 [Streptomyces sp. JB150]